MTLLSSSKAEHTPSVILTKEFMCFYCYFMRVNEDIHLLVSLSFSFVPSFSPYLLLSLLFLSVFLSFLISVSFSHCLGLMNISAEFLQEKVSCQCIFSLLMASVAYHVSECWVLGIDSGVDEAGFHLVICPQLSGNSLGSLTEVKDCHLPHSLLVPETRPGLFSLGKRISYSSFNSLDFTPRFN